MLHRLKIKLLRGVVIMCEIWCCASEEIAKQLAGMGYTIIPSAKPYYYLCGKILGGNNNEDGNITKEEGEQSL